MFAGLANWLFDPAGLTPHGFCLLWQPGLIWTYATADVGIGMAYFSIPVALVVFARRRRDLVFRPLLWLFAAFILLCGATHWLDVVTLWVPAYGVQAVVKAVTAVVSLVTAAALWRLLPHALALPSSGQLRDLNAALATSEARHRANFERSPVPLYTVDEFDIVTAVSESWLALLGYSRDQVVGRNIGAFRTPASDLLDDSRRAELMRAGVLLDQERRFQRSDGGVVEAVVSARLDDRVDGISIICVLIDVTARRRAEAALRASEERLFQAQKMEAVGQLTGGIAHDFNNMLQGITGCLDRIGRLADAGRSQDVARYVAAAQHSVDRAANLTKRMLAFARRQALEPRAVEPDAFMRDIAELIERTMGPAIRLRMALHDGVWSVRCDANQLESVMLNLAINARDAMPEGGTLSIATADRLLAGADLADQPGAAPGAYVEIAVTDTGRGIPPELLSRVFEPFFTTKPIGQGTGLGLSQVYGFVSQSGGFVRLDSSLGRGTTVRLYLPRDATVSRDGGAPRDQRDTERPARVALATVGRSVLVVDDERTVRSLATEALHDVGCLVLEAEDAAAGLRILQSSVAVDLLVTDIGLPGLNGRQFAGRARQLRPLLPVLFITGHAGTALEEAAIEPGMEILRKPFALDALCDRVHTMLEASNVAFPGSADAAVQATG